MTLPDTVPFYMNNTKLSTEIRRNQFAVGERSVINSAGAGSPSLTICYTINLVSRSDVTFNYLDHVVSNALYSIYKYKAGRSENLTFTLAELLRVITGGSPQTLTTTKRDALQSSVDKLRNTDIFIRFTDEAAKKDWEMLSLFIDKDGRETTLKRGDAEVFGKLAPLKKLSGSRYRFTARMPLFYYAEKTRQIISCPAEKLKSNAPDTLEAIMIKHFLLQRLEIVRSQKANNDNMKTILYTSDKDTGLLDQIGIKRTADRFGNVSAWHKKIKSVHKLVRELLEQYVSAGYISSYKVGVNGTEVADDLSGRDVPEGVVLYPVQKKQANQ